MINTDVFVRRLAEDLDKTLTGKKVLWIYSSSPTELIFNFSSFSFLINFVSSYTLIRQEDAFVQPGKHWLRQFSGIEQHKITGVRAHYGERILYLDFEHGLQLAWLMRGAQGFVFEPTSSSRFPFSRQAYSLPPLEQHLTVEQYETLPSYPSDLFPWYRHKDLKAIWRSQFWQEIGLKNPKEALLQLESDWQIGKIYVGVDASTTLPFLEIACVATGAKSHNIAFETNSALEGITWFSRKFLSLFAFSNMRKTMQGAIEKRIKRLEAQIRHLKQELEEDKSAFWQHQADLVMAHMHLKPNLEGKLEVVDFLTNQSLLIQVDPEKPAKTAAKWYKKARNTRMLQEEQLTSLFALDEALEEANRSLTSLNELDDLKQLKSLYKKVQQKETQEKETKYRVYQIGEFRVLVGKQAESNQEILRTAHKDDLWFHARGYSGSHVLIQKAGRNPGPKVIQQAAALAAFFSRGKTAGLCPVQYTARKYVRQAKGLEAGQVIVDREEVILVEPGLPE